MLFEMMQKDLTTLVLILLFTCNSSYSLSSLYHTKTHTSQVWRQDLSNQCLHSKVTFKCHLLHFVRELI